MNKDVGNYMKLRETLSKGINSLKKGLTPSLDLHQTFTNLLKRCRECGGVVQNKKKVKLRLKEVTFMGHVFTNKGLKIDPEKTKAVKQMPTPTNTNQHRRGPMAKSICNT